MVLGLLAHYSDTLMSVLKRSPAAEGKKSAADGGIGNIFILVVILIILVGGRRPPPLSSPPPSLHDSWSRSMGGSLCYNIV